MNQVINLQTAQFLLIYVLLLVILFVMKRAGVDRTKLLVTASMKMSIQLILAGMILEYVFKQPHIFWTLLYLLVMLIFTIHRILSREKQMNRSFQIIVGLSVTFSGLFTLLYFIFAVVGRGAFGPQYMIPIFGMLMGNSMTGVSLGLKTLGESLSEQEERIEALTCIGTAPSDILMPFVKQSFETAILPTLNAMAGMGIVALPGMMTGQILAGTDPSIAILYQIAIMIAIATTVALSSFLSLYYGSRTLYDTHTHMIDVTKMVGKK